MMQNLFILVLLASLGCQQVSARPLASIPEALENLVRGLMQGIHRLMGNEPTVESTRPPVAPRPPRPPPVLRRPSGGSQKRPTLNNVIHPTIPFTANDAPFNSAVKVVTPPSIGIPINNVIDQGKPRPSQGARRPPLENAPATFVLPISNVIEHGSPRAPQKKAPTRNVLNVVTSPRRPPRPTQEMQRPTNVVQQNPTLSQGSKHIPFKGPTFSNVAQPVKPTKVKTALKVVASPTGETIFRGQIANKHPGKHHKHEKPQHHQQPTSTITTVTEAAAEKTTTSAILETEHLTEAPEKATTTTILETEQHHQTSTTTITILEPEHLTETPETTPFVTEPVVTTSRTTIPPTEPLVITTARTTIPPVEPLVTTSRTTIAPAEPIITTTAKTTIAPATENLLKSADVVDLRTPVTNSLHHLDPEHSHAPIFLHSAEGAKTTEGGALKTPEDVGTRVHGPARGDEGTNVQIHIRFEMDPQGQIKCLKDSDCPQERQGFLINSMCDLKAKWSGGDVCVAFSNQDCLEIHTHEECQRVSREKEEERMRNAEECKVLSVCERDCTVRSCLAACQQTFTCLPQKPLFAAPLVILEMVEEAKKTEEKRTLEEVKLETDENREIGTTAEVKETEITKEIKENDIKLEEEEEEEVVKTEIENIKAEVIGVEKLIEIAEEELIEEENEIDNNLKEGEEEIQEETEIENVEVEVVAEEVEVVNVEVEVVAEEVEAVNVEVEVVEDEKLSEFSEEELVEEKNENENNLDKEVIQEENEIENVKVEIVADEELVEFEEEELVEDMKATEEFEEVESEIVEFEEAEATEEEESIVTEEVESSEQPLPLVDDV